MKWTQSAVSSWWRDVDATYGSLSIRCAVFLLLCRRVAQSSSGRVVEDSFADNRPVARAGCRASRQLPLACEPTIVDTWRRRGCTSRRRICVAAPPDASLYVASSHYRSYERRATSVRSGVGSLHTSRPSRHVAFVPSSSCLGPRKGTFFFFVDSNGS